MAEKISVTVEMHRDVSIPVCFSNLFFELKCEVDLLASCKLP